MGYDTLQERAALAEPWMLLDHCEDVVVVTDHTSRVIYRNARESSLTRDTSACNSGDILWDFFPRTRDDLFESELRGAIAARHPCVIIADFPSVGRFAVRGFPHGEKGFALFLRELPTWEASPGVREVVPSYMPPGTVSYAGAFKIASPERAAAAASEFEQGREFQRRFLTEVLANVTDGRLRLCNRESDLPAPLPAVGEPIVLTTPETLASFRRRIEAAGVLVGMPLERTRELITAAGEAAMNGVVHAGGGTATIHGVPGGARMQICVVDTGGGIADENLHRATLERGYTTAGSLGLGFSLMHAVADRVYLLTRASGTVIVLEQNAVPPAPDETRFQFTSL